MTTTISYWFMVSAAFVSLFVTMYLINNRNKKAYKYACEGAVAPKARQFSSQSQYVQRTAKGKNCGYEAVPPYQFEAEQAFLDIPLSQRGATTEDGVFRDTKARYEQRQTIIGVIVLSLLIAAIVLISVGIFVTDWIDADDGVVLLGFVTIFPIINFLYSRFGSKRYANEYGKSRKKGTKQAVKELVAGERSIYRNKLQRGFGNAFLVTSIASLLLYIILTNDIGIWNLLIIPIMIISIGSLLHTYHNDGVEIDVVMEEDDVARSKTVRVYFLTFGGIILGLFIVLIALFGEQLTSGEIVSYGGIISIILSIAVTKIRNSRHHDHNSKMDDCVDNDFEGEMCADFKDEYCEKYPDADICQE
jgi:hypothetical protein